MSVLGEAMQYAAGSLDAMTPLLIMMLAGIVMILIALAWDAYH